MIECYICPIVKKLKEFNEEGKCAFCRKKVEGKLRCLWDALDCFHRRSPCVGLCKECYDKEVTKVMKEREWIQKLKDKMNKK